MNGPVLLTREQWAEISITLDAQRSLLSRAYHTLLALQDGSISPESVSDLELLPLLAPFAKY
jgi:hypothetical protein